MGADAGAYRCLMVVMWKGAGPSLFVFLRVIFGFTDSQDYRSEAAIIFTLT
jgi:hypothetical protein